MVKCTIVTDVTIITITIVAATINSVGITVARVIANSEVSELRFCCYSLQRHVINATFHSGLSQ